MIRKLYSNNIGSVWPVIIVVICFAVASFLILVGGHILEPLMNNILGMQDDNVDSDIMSPRLSIRGFVNLIWPRGILLVILFGCIFGMLMYYQKRRYKT